MTSLVKPSKIKGLYYISIKINSFRYLKIMSSITNMPIYNFSSKPVENIIELIKCSEKILSKVNWNTKDFNEKHGKNILELLKKIKVNELGKYYVEKE